MRKRGELSAPTQPVGADPVAEAQVNGAPQTWQLGTNRVVSEEERQPMAGTSEDADAGHEPMEGPAGPDRGQEGRAERLASLLRHPPSKRFTARVLLAGSIVVLSTLTNRGFLGWGLFVTCALLVVPTGRTRSFILSFVPYAGVWFVFTALRSLADETTLAQALDTNVARLERWLFGGQLPSIVLQDRFFDPQRLRWHDYFLTSVHWSYYLIPHAVAIRTWQKHPARFRHFMAAMTLLLAVGLGIYFLVPTKPPWLAPPAVESPAAAEVSRVMEPVGKALGGGLYSASYRVVGESNPIAALPSIHMAITFLLVFVAAEAGRRWRALALLYSGLMGLALVYLGEHYVVDIAVGMMVAAYGWFAAGLWLRRVAPVLRSRFVRPLPGTRLVGGTRA